ncbi:LacI family DNA-binding transcriptional regulator [Mycetocola sp. JXN-3]|uniref:LacI family DNA-binding transcriptional regulator n=1 Tax=Mycetocola sp. JXN-3 TaxID=2116510 RepID=UPI00165CF79E|nr:LacI family DNA-binding transcriptional regulator [Mycetocola sp. JXN-3]
MSAADTSAKDSRRPDGSIVTIADVAAAAGVSKTTVSHVLSSKRPVSAATRRTVERVMAELGFQPNFFARVLNGNRSATIALIAQDITNPFYPSLARGLQKAVSASGHVVMLFDGDAGPAAIGTFIEDAIQRRVDGVVVAVADIDEHTSALLRAQIPVVAVGSFVSHLDIDWVTADDVRIAEDAVARLASTGHTRIATISGPRSQPPAAPRLAGFESGLRAAGLEAPVAHLAEGDWSRASGFARMTELLAADPAPTAVFCANDLMAIGAVDAVRQAGLPAEAVAIIGVDDIDAASLITPALTTVRIPAEEIGRAAGELLLHRIDSGTENGSPRHVSVQHRLILRESA